MGGRFPLHPSPGRERAFTSGRDDPEYSGVLDPIHVLSSPYRFMRCRKLPSCISFLPWHPKLSRSHIPWDIIIRKFHRSSLFEIFHQLFFTLNRALDKFSQQIANCLFFVLLMYRIIWCWNFRTDFLTGLTGFTRFALNSYPSTDTLNSVRRVTRIFRIEFSFYKTSPNPSHLSQFPATYHRRELLHR